MKTSKLQSRFETDSFDYGEEGFVSAQFILLMTFSVILIATFVNIFLIEYTRYAAQNVLYDAARTGTQVYDLQRAEESIDSTFSDAAILGCEVKLEESVSDLIGGALENETYNCDIVQNPISGAYSMRAELQADPVLLFLLAEPFRARVSSGLSATYEQRQLAQ